MAAILGTLAGSAISSALGGGQQSSSAYGVGSLIPTPAPPGAATANNRNQITVAPIGINLGSVIQPYIQGSETNGGSGLAYDSAMSNMPYPIRSAHVLNIPVGTDTEILPYVIGGIALVALLAVAMKLRKRG